MVYREFSCFLCGKKGIDKSTRQNRMFCSGNCKNKYYYRMTVSDGIRKGKDSDSLCIHNKDVFCRSHNCDKCGWNPAVAKKRIEAILSEVEIDGEE